MTHKKMQQLMLTFYLIAIEVVETCNDGAEAYQVLSDESLQSGLCCAISNHTGEPVYSFESSIGSHKPWIDPYKGNDGFWGEPPEDAYRGASSRPSKKALIAALRLRVNILHVILEQQGEG